MERKQTISNIVRFLHEFYGVTGGIAEYASRIDSAQTMDENALLCECKWRNSATALDVITLLEERGELFHFEYKYYIVFSKNGFTDEVSDYDDYYVVSKSDAEERLKKAKLFYEEMKQYIVKIVE